MKTVAERFVHAHTKHDSADVLNVFASDVDSHGMTPSRSWEASTAEGPVEDVLLHWIDVHDLVQQADLMVDDGRSPWRRMMCSGFRKVD